MRLIIRVEGQVKSRPPLMWQYIGKVTVFIDGKEGLQGSDSDTQASRHTTAPAREMLDRLGYAGNAIGDDRTEHSIEVPTFTEVRERLNAIINSQYIPPPWRSIPHPLRKAIEQVQRKIESYCAQEERERAERDSIERERAEAERARREAAEAKAKADAESRSRHEATVTVVPTPPRTSFFRHGFPQAKFSHIENLVFQGGGVKGIAYLGALDYLLTKNYLELGQIKRVCGASAGAITALMLALGYSFAELTELMNRQNIGELLDDAKVNPSCPAYEGEATSGLNFTAREAFFKILEMLKVTEDVDKNTLDLIIYIACKALEFNGEELCNSLLHDHPQAKGVIQFLIAITGDIIPNISQFFLNYIAERFTTERITNIEELVLRQYFQRDQTRLGFFITALSGVITGILEHGVGIFPGKACLEWFEQQIRIKTGRGDITFAQFSAWQKTNPACKELYVVAVNLGKGITQVFSARHTPDVVIADAVRVSMSIPYLFKPHRVRMYIRERPVFDDQLYTDGGLNDNYPLWVFDDKSFTGASGLSARSQRHFDYNVRTLGFKLVTAEQKQFFERGRLSLSSYKYDCDLLTYSKLLLAAMLNKQDSDHYSSDDSIRTVYIDTLNVNTVDFQMSQDVKEELKKSGRNCAEQYMLRRSCLYFDRAIEVFKQSENIRDRKCAERLKAAADKLRTVAVGEDSQRRLLIEAPPDDPDDSRGYTI